MRRLRGRHPVSRSMSFLAVLLLGAWLLEIFFHADAEIFIGTMSTAMLMLGVLLCLMPLDFREYDQTNRWYHAAYRASWVVYVVLGALVIGTAVMWVITRQTLDGLFVLIGGVWAIVGALLIGGLGAIGAIAKATEETRESARSWGRARGAAGARSAEEDSLPE